ncbi:acyl-CoA thioesterase [Bacillus horti]|uniref:Acyl-CoA hydrolase n=1 Tax=Caldalkalibacillus horti TaxID=77523 RepID=A0ABT9W098_9BACI|nr:acyl-CoA thioesterase [Bacillus horti]MDQ0166668.1 acyl-CoA hydrolase [Bacillus horti]
MTVKYCRESRCVRTSHVMPSDTNNHQTMFGGKLMSNIDDIASIAAMRHCRTQVVTASTDSVDFLHPIRPGHSVCLEAYVTHTGKSSMEVFVKVIAEHLLSGERLIAATSFLTFVALDENRNIVPVPAVIPETDEEKKLHETAAFRAQQRKQRREESKKLASFLTTNKPWE